MSGVDLRRPSAVLDPLGFACASSPSSAISRSECLITLGLGNNFSLTNIGALVDLTNLHEVLLVNNVSLSNIQPLLNNTGLSTGDLVELVGTNVSCTDVVALELKEVTVISDCP